MTQITEDEKFSAISEPDFDPLAVEVPDEGPMKFEFDLEVRPEFDLPEWKGLTIERPVREFTKKDIDKRLAGSPYLMGDALNVLDIAWFIYAFRLSLAGYPFRRLHPHVAAWEEKLRARPEFAKEIAGTRKPATPVNRTLEQVAGPHPDPAFDAE